MDALTSLGIDPKLLIAQVINFGILFFALSKFLYKPLVSILDERKNKIERGLKDSLEAGEKLSQAQTQSKKQIAEAVSQANSIVEMAKKEADTEAKKIVTKAEQKASDIVARAKEAAKQQEDEVMKSVRPKIADLVSVAFEKIANEQADKDSIARAVKDLK